MAKSRKAKNTSGNAKVVTRTRSSKKPSFVCQHCAKEFDVDLRWCPGCEDHASPLFGWDLDGNRCARCKSGANGGYLEWKRGHAGRVAAAVASMEDKGNWCGCGAAESFNLWITSKEYQTRFDPPTENDTIVPNAGMIRCGGKPKYGVSGMARIGDGPAAHEDDGEEDGIWPPFEESF